MPWPLLTGSLLGGGVGSSLVSGGLSLLGGQMMNKAQGKEADRAYGRQLYLSNSAHTREVKDLRAAGLNPILSANRGASTPNPPMPVMKDVLTPAVSSALQARQLNNVQRETDARIKLMHDQAGAARAQGRNSDAQAILAGVTGDVKSKDLNKAGLLNQFWGWVSKTINEASDNISSGYQQKLQSGKRPPGYDQWKKSLTTSNVPNMIEIKRDRQDLGLERRK